MENTHFIGMGVSVNMSFFLLQFTIPGKGHQKFCNQKASVKIELLMD